MLGGPGEPPAPPYAGARRKEDKKTMSTHPADDVLVLGMGYRPYKLDDKTVAVSTKYHEVMTEFGTRWPGEVRYQLETGDHRLVDMEVELRLDEFPVNAFHFDRSKVSAADFPVGAMCLMPLETGLRNLHKLVSDAELRLLRGSDYPPGIARAVIMLTEDRDLKGKLGGLLYTEKEKWQQIWEVKHAAGIQSNQFATYDYYERYARDRLAFIDTRIRDGEPADQHDMAERKARYLADEPLHLAFSGRLDPMKSPLDIAEIARSLRDRGVPFRYSVFGDGPLKDPLEAKLREYGLRDRFELHGFVDLRDTLLPMMKKELDIFVGNHRQGDTSTSYPEYMSAGVPVVSYPNPAVKALKRHFGVTTHAESIDPESLAARIAELHHDRARLWQVAERDHAWGQHQTIGAAHQQRIDHVLEHRERYHAALARR
jgi:glycosyltransferase involved in cell wall biosynthesis